LKYLEVDYLNDATAGLSNSATQKIMEQVSGEIKVLCDLVNDYLGYL
jgi:hypothetical protein